MFVNDIFSHSISDKKQNYFIGTSYMSNLHANKFDINDVDRRDVIDGQQRITTFLLINKILSTRFNIQESIEFMHDVDIKYSSLDQNA
jgi:uncharacterized protein with ParB-like and HNH nuclease domain